MPSARRVTVRMKDRRAHGRKNDALVGGEIELHARQAAGAGRHRAAITQLALATRVAARVGEDFKVLTLRREFEAGTLINPSRDFAEDALEESLVEMARIEQREIEVFRKAIGLKVAFLQACAALEHPAVRQLRMRIDARERPAEGVVFLNNMRDSGQPSPRCRGVRACRSWAALRQPAVRHPQTPARDKRAGI